ncbi:MAG: InlB B-repeat-containing protein, partial [Erysipelotrichaceae bacterium]|nr:InlB B-repeat-containing protein [Erysipelotrichaceae bacterium]
TTLYAGWKPQEFTLTFSAGQGSGIAPVTVIYNETVDLRNYTPVRRGYTFAGWYTDCSCSQKAENQITLTSNVTLYAKWKSRL